MKRLEVICVLLLLTLFQACAPHYFATTWKKNRVQMNYDNVLVAAVLNNSNPNQSSLIESELVKELSRAGYKAVGSVHQFGLRGLEGLGEEATYTRLCDQGIDAVLVVALIDRRKDKETYPPANSRYPDNYYYKRVWNYRSIVADWSVPDTMISQRYCWETILFDLRTLEAVCILQTPEFSALAVDRPKGWPGHTIHTLIREKVLVKKPALAETLRAF